MQKEKKDNAQDAVQDTLDKTEELELESETEDLAQQEDSEDKNIKDSYVRLAAEYENYRRRTAKEKSDIYDNCVIEVAQKILPVLDNLDLALENAESCVDSSTGSIKQGVEMIHKQFVETLDKMDIAKIDSLGKPFNPELHNAVMVEEDHETESGTIVDVFQEGYMYKDRIVRYSMVKVAK